LAVAYHEVLFIVDMRMPEIILRKEEGADKGKHSLPLPRHEKHDPIVSMIWTVSTLPDGELVSKLQWKAC
jgi:hypothetical protein